MTGSASGMSEIELPPHPASARFASLTKPAQPSYGELGVKGGSCAVGLGNRLVATGLTLLSENGRCRVTTYTVGRRARTPIPLGRGEVIVDGTHLSHRWVRPRAAPVPIRPVRPTRRSSVRVVCLRSGREVRKGGGEG